MNKLYAGISWVILLITPIALIGLGVRVLLTPVFPNLEYRLPDFPTDQYGFTTQDRLHWGMYGINYLTNSADISYLGDLSFSPGVPLFTDRELAHMQDVKIVTQQFLRFWLAVLAVLLLLGLWAWRGRWQTFYLQGLRRGGWFTLLLAILVGSIATFGSLGSGDLFWTFFSGFHGLFFQGNSWLFLDSDSLIRLYPLKFWEDAVLYIGIVSAVGAAGLAFGIRPAKHRDPVQTHDV